MLHIYRALELNLPRLLKKRVPARDQQPLGAAKGCWSLAFTSDVLTDGRRFRTLNVVDDYNRELLGVQIDFSWPASQVTRLVERYSRPTQLCADNGPKLISVKLSERCAQQGITLHWIRGYKLTQNAYIERFNDSSRRGLLDAYLLHLLAYVRQFVGEWRHDYNIQRPH